MPSELPQSFSQGLPPVTPPSGRFIAQLFLVPGLIVAVAVLLVLAFSMLVGNTQSPDYLLSKLDSNNDDVRWRGASDLAQTLERKENVELRSNAKFALDLCDRLRRALADLTATEKAVAEQIKSVPEQDKEKMWRRLDPKRSMVMFLTSALADFNMPVGAPLLCELALREESPDVKHNAHLRRMAVFALGNLGENLKAFAGLPGVKQTAILGELRKEAGGSKERAAWARTALYYLQWKAANSKDSAARISAVVAAKGQPLDALTSAAIPSTTPEGVVLVDHVLARCARADDPALREFVAWVLGFWNGDLVEPTLLMLARDNGHGATITAND